MGARVPLATRQSSDAGRPGAPPAAQRIPTAVELPTRPHNSPTHFANCPFQAFLMRRADPATRRPRPPMPSSRSPTARCSRRRRRRRRIHPVSNSAALSVSPTPSIITGGFARAILKSAIRSRTTASNKHRRRDAATLPRHAGHGTPLPPSPHAGLSPQSMVLDEEPPTQRGGQKQNQRRKGRGQTRAQVAHRAVCAASRIGQLAFTFCRSFALPCSVHGHLTTHNSCLPTLYSNRSNSTQLIRRRTRLTLAPLEALCWT